MADVLRESRAYVARPDNDFWWSSWEDAADALAEIDALIAALDAGTEDPREAAVLFAPTGPMQEVALSGGWGNAFLDLANRFDAALAAAVRQLPP